jgi:hypothetical protein
MRCAVISESDMKNLYASVLLVGLLSWTFLALKVGPDIGMWLMRKNKREKLIGLILLKSTVLVLIGLLTVFTFVGTSFRFDTKRGLIVNEANVIRLAYQRIDLLSAAAQPTIRQNFRAYVDNRLAIYRKLPDFEAARKEMSQATALQDEIWLQAVAACEETKSAMTTTLVLSAIGQMIDMTTSRSIAIQTHPLEIICGLIGTLALASSLLAGYENRRADRRSWIHIVGYAVIATMTIYVFIDLANSHVGQISTHAEEQVLVDLRNSIK